MIIGLSPFPEMCSLVILRLKQLPRQRPGRQKVAAMSPHHSPYASKRKSRSRGSAWEDDRTMRVSDGPAAGLFPLRTRVRLPSDWRIAAILYVTAAGAKVAIESHVDLSVSQPMGAQSRSPLVAGMPRLSKACRRSEAWSGLRQIPADKKKPAQGGTGLKVSPAIKGRVPGPVSGITARRWTIRTRGRPEFPGLAERA